MPVKTKKRKRKIRKSVLVGLIVIVIALIAGILFVPGMMDDSKLKKLGYDKPAIAAIKKNKLSKEILKNKYYSDGLKKALAGEDFDKDYLQLYLNKDEVSKDDILLYAKLKKREYTDDQLLNLFKNLKFYELTPLLVFDKIEDTDAYLKDCQKYASVNSISHFELGGSYVKRYESTESTANPGNVNMLVNKHYYLNEDFVPADLVELKMDYATKGRSMNKEAADAFIELCKAVWAEGLKLYASSTYRDYAYQVELYNSYVKRYGEKEADRIAARPGFSEHQTGLTVDLTSTSQGPTMTSFKDTKEYPWMLENGHKYGYILRYPEGKETITGYDFESWHYRYVGKELAKKVYESGLTYDEYYLLYIAE